MSEPTITISLARYNDEQDKLSSFAAAIQRVRDLHKQTMRLTCTNCVAMPYPCPTIRALDGEQDDL